MQVKQQEKKQKTVKARNLGKNSQSKLFTLGCTSERCRAVSLLGLGPGTKSPQSSESFPIIFASRWYLAGQASESGLGKGKGERTGSTCPTGAKPGVRLESSGWPRSMQSLQFQITEAMRPQRETFLQLLECQAAAKMALLTSDASSSSSC